MDRRLGTFLGVYTPTVLTILGVIMYLRFGWLVGHLGLLQVLAIVLLAHVVTITTTMSFSSWPPTVVWAQAELLHHLPQPGPRGGRSHRPAALSVPGVLGDALRVWARRILRFVVPEPSATHRRRVVLLVAGLSLSGRVSP